MLFMSIHLGIDASTQSLTALFIDPHKGEILHEDSVTFGRDLPQYGAPHGFIEGNDPLIRHADPLMWVDALDLLLARLRDDGAPLNHVSAISGSGQQHGTVYLSTRVDAFPDSSSDHPLRETVADKLSRKTSPIWMDSSTTAECREIDRALGGPGEVRKRSGSSATERFAGPQIRRFAKESPDDYAATEIIHLVSSFLCSLIAGRDAPIDLGDGAGMNLLNLRSGDWDSGLLNATAPALREKLPDTAPCNQVVGTVDPALAARFGINPEARVVVWSGDNPNSLIGVGGWEPGTAVVSLGTSDTYFAAMAAPRVDPCGCGHVFGNPAGGFMSLICFKNGSLARERIKDRFAMDWETFDNFHTEGSPGGGSANLVLPYFVPEITPVVLDAKPVYNGSARFRTDPEPLAAVRALVESQALSMRIHSSWMRERPGALRLTGGASKSAGICRVFADVFNADVYRLEVSNSAALGAAMRAANAAENIPWKELTDAFCAPAGAPVHPIAENVGAYDELATAYTELEAAYVYRTRR
jgi:xylulokinase